MNIVNKFNLAYVFAGLTIFSVAKASAETQTVIMKSISFQPKKIELAVGDSVVWSNESYTEHSALADENNSFDTGMIQPKKQSKSILFNKPGSYAYHCALHGKSMSGLIIVKAKQ